MFDAATSLSDTAAALGREHGRTPNEPVLGR
jgi:hypothetical protein